MSTKKLTPWFPAATKPSRPGEYEVLHEGDDELVRRYWTGSEWQSHGYICAFGKCGYAGDKWRGLAKEPK